MPMYPEIMVVPMREELTRLGIEELRTPEEVDEAVKQTGTAMVVVNSICGCAAGRMRPAVRLALQNAARPRRLILYSPVRTKKPPTAPADTSPDTRRRRPRSAFCGTASLST